MKLPNIRLILTLLGMIFLTACGVETTAPPPPPTATVVSYLTEPQPAETATIPAPTFTSTPLPAPTPTNTLVPTATVPLPPTPTPEAAQPTIRVNETLGNRINVRNGPGTDYPVVGQFEPGQEAVVTGRNVDSSWWQVSLADAAGASAIGWVYGELVTLTGDSSAISVAEAPPPPPTATPAPQPPAGQDEAGNQGSQPQSSEEADQLRCGKDFCITYQAMVPMWENGGCIGNHSIYITVLEGPPPGRPMDGVVIGDTFNNVEVASGDKGPGSAEITLWMNSMSVKAKRHINGAPYSSEESFSFTSHDELIPAEVLAANGYCEGNVEKCRVAQQNNQVCRGHYSWRVTFHKFD